MIKSVMMLTMAVVVLLQVACSKSEGRAETLKDVPLASTSTASQPTVGQTLKPPLKTYDGPLGLSMGIPVDILTEQLLFKESFSDIPNVYAGVPPKPAPDFDTYHVLATSGQGICRVSAISNVDVVNDNGDQLKSETDRIAEMIETKYGRRTNKFDFATQDVYRKHPQFFLMALRKKAVTYTYTWVNGERNLALPNDLAEIVVQAGASEMGKGWVILTYFFENRTKCDDETKKQKSTNL